MRATMTPTQRQKPGQKRSEVSDAQRDDAAKRHIAKGNSLTVQKTFSDGDRQLAFCDGINIYAVHLVKGESEGCRCSCPIFKKNATCDHVICCEALLQADLERTLQS